MTRDPYASLKHGLVGAWIPSISGSGLLLPDLSGRGNNGVLTNMDASDWVASGTGRALDFDGSNDYVSAANQTTITNAIISVSAWIRTPDLSLSTNFPRLLDLSDGTNSLQIVLDVGSSGSDQVATKHSQYQSSISATQWGYLPVSNTWEHVTVIFDSISSQTTLYRNGVQRTGSSNNNVGAASAVNQLFIGARRDLNGQTHWDGFIDDIRIYNRALTEPEIRLLASKRGIGLQPSPTRFIAKEKKTGLRRRILTGQT